MRLATGIAIALLLVMGVPRTVLGQNLTIKLSLALAEYKPGDAVPIEYSVTNNESKAVAVLKWNTPLEGLIGDPFAVNHEGTAQPFFGVMLLRTDPIASDWVTIPAKGTVSATVNLASAYDLSPAGAYQVLVRHGFQHVAFGSPPRIAIKALRRRDLQSNTVAFRMLESGKPPPRPMQTPGGAAAVSFSGCNSDQQAALTKASSAMQTEATKVSVDVANWPACANWSKSATSFLGACNDTGLAVAKSVTSTITRRGPTEILDCSGTRSCAPLPSNCTKPNVLAFTCLGGPNSTIYLCSSFFSMPVENEIDSQQTALYHELSHWAYTQDYAYGCKNCADLAGNNPSQAQNNASSFMYFAIFQATGKDPSCGCSVSRVTSSTNKSAWAFAMLAAVALSSRIRRRDAPAKTRGADPNSRSHRGIAGNLRRTGPCRHRVVNRAAVALAGQ
ncbi:MAG TPA: M35 family metallo-endopeptidase, partial [Polyangiaceae bacterium]